MSEERVGGVSERARIIRTIFGLVCSPIIGAVVTMPLTLLVIQLVEGSAVGIPADHIVPSIQTAATMGAYVGWPVAFLFGWPIHVGLMQRNASKALHYALFGALSAVVTFMVAITIIGVVRFILEWQVALFGFSLLTAGAIGGLVFWLIRRPDRDTRPTLPADSPHEHKV